MPAKPQAAEDMRYLAIDLGDKRTGLAVGDDVTRIVSPLEVITTASSDERLRRIGLAVDEHGPDALVVGLPLNMDGTEGPAAKKVRAVMKQLQQRFKLRVHATDERLSSAAADTQMERTGLTHKGKKERRDALAAANILRSFLESRV